MRIPVLSSSKGHIVLLLDANRTQRCAQPSSPQSPHKRRKVSITPPGKAAGKTEIRMEPSALVDLRATSMMGSAGMCHSDPDIRMAPIITSVHRARPMHDAHSRAGTMFHSDIYFGHDGAAGVAKVTRIAFECIREITADDWPSNS